MTEAKALTSKPPISEEVSYQEASELFRHYSAMRATTVTFLISISFGLAGLALTNTQFRPLLVYLLTIEIMIYFFAVFSSIYFSASLNYIRKLLITMEAGDQVNLYNRLDLFRIVKNIHFDPFDWFIILFGLIVHTAVISYIVIV
jgi:hypothetical protein